VGGQFEFYQIKQKKIVWYEFKERSQPTQTFNLFEKYVSTLLSSSVQGSKTTDLVSQKELVNHTFSDFSIRCKLQ